MEVRSTKKLVALIFVTLGLYSLVWFSRSRDVLAKDGHRLPSLWFFILPFGAYWWVWQYSQALEIYTKAKIKGNDTFLLFLIATMAGGVSFSYADDFFSDINIILVLTGIGFTISTAIYCIFFYVMQKKFNQLETSL